SCPEEDEIPDLALDADCDYEEPDYKGLLTGFENFENNPVIEQSTSREGDILNVILVVRDGEGGEVVDECSFQVEITDETKPNINCPSEKNEFFDPQVGFTVPDYGGEVGISDNCTPEEELRQNLVQTPAPGEIIFVSQPISFTVEDASGNPDNCSFFLTLFEDADEVPPTFIDCPSANGITQEAAPGLC